MKSGLVLACLALLIAMSATAQSETENCNAYENWEAVAAKARNHTIFFAELHGTEQSLEAVKGLICELAADGMAIRFGIETPEDQGAALNAALEPPFDESAIRQAAPFLWSTPDGHSSEAVLDLLNDLSRLRAAGLDAGVFAFVEGDTPARSEYGHETTMAQNIDAATQGFDGAVIVLIGSAHAILNPPDSGRTGGSAAAEIQAREPLVLKMQYEAGTTWALMYSTNGDEISPPQSVASNYKADAPRRTFELGSDSGYESGYYYTGPVTASPPAFPDAVN